jgi:hypothetical protein
MQSPKFNAAGWRAAAESHEGRSGGVRMFFVERDDLGFRTPEERGENGPCIVTEARSKHHDEQSGNAHDDNFGAADCVNQTLVTGFAQVNGSDSRNTFGNGEDRRASARRLRCAFPAHRVVAHFDAMEVWNRMAQ